MTRKNLWTALIAVAVVTASILPGLSAASKPDQNARPDIVDTAISAGSFETLVAAVQAAGLVETLKGEGPFTVFAPTDDAFAKLPEGTVEKLLQEENREKLQAILTYHVVAGKVMSKDVVKMKKAKTVQGEELTIAIEKDKAMIDGAEIVKADIETSNGVIHVIDSVMLPQLD